MLLQVDLGIYIYICMYVSVIFNKFNWSGMFWEEVLTLSSEVIRFKNKIKLLPLISKKSWCLYI